MPYDIRLVRLVSGEIVLGKFDEANALIKEVALLQTIPTEQGMQMMLLPFGFPFEQSMSGEISLNYVIYQYKTFPEELKTRYLEAVSNITLSPVGALRNLEGLAAKWPVGQVPNFAGLIKK